MGITYAEARASWASPAGELLAVPVAGLIGVAAQRGTVGHVEAGVGDVALVPTLERDLVGEEVQGSGEHSEVVGLHGEGQLVSAARGRHGSPSRSDGP